jgi:uncharacterized protein (TIGR02996 family)
MTDDQGLFQAILDNPDDDGVRLIYADYLDEHGEPQRADFIRVQIELALLPEDDPRRGDLEARERALLEEHEEWLTPLDDLAEFTEGRLLISEHTLGPVAIAGNLRTLGSRRSRESDPGTEEESRHAGGLPDPVRRADSARPFALLRVLD